MNITIIYGSDSGTTGDIAEKIAGGLNATVKVIDVARVENSDFEEAENLILGSSTWGEGDLQDDWDGFIEALDDIDLSNKKVAVFGLGDQESYGDSFVGAMGTIYEKAKERGATMVGGGVSPEGYTFEESIALVDDVFVGLPLDEDNQDELTDERIAAWCAQLQKEFA